MHFTTLFSANLIFPTNSHLTVRVSSWSGLPQKTLHTNKQTRKRWHNHQITALFGSICYISTEHFTLTNIAKTNDTTERLTNKSIETRIFHFLLHLGFLPFQNAHSETYFIHISYSLLIITQSRYSHHSLYYCFTPSAFLDHQ